MLSDQTKKTFSDRGNLPSDELHYSMTESGNTSADDTFIETVMERNREFVASKGYEKYASDKFPNLRTAIVTCMDARLIRLLPEALGLANGDVNIIKNASGTISNPFDSAMRSLLIAVYQLGVRRIMIVGHTGCGVQGMSGSEMTALMRKRGIDSSRLETMSRCGIDVEKWLTGFEDSAKAVRDTVDLVSHHPLMPDDVTVGGFIIDSHTGQLTAL